MDANDMRYVNRTHAQTKFSIEHTSVGLAHSRPIKNGQEVYIHLLWRRFMGIYRDGRRPEGYIPKNLRTPAGGMCVYIQCHACSRP